MWAKTFPERLQEWAALREQCAQLDPKSALEQINSWWFNCPWRPYHLHWDDRESWPDPWQLLDDNVYCPLARGLGILYTITLLDRPDMQDAVLTEVENDNLVLVANEKYILNWDGDEIVNINPGRQNLRRRISQQDIKQQIQ